jgi:hypothetical protein
MGTFYSQEMKLYPLSANVEKLTFNYIKDKNIYIIGSIEHNLIQKLVGNDALVIGEYDVNYSNLHQMQLLPKTLPSVVVVNNDINAIVDLNKYLSIPHHSNLTIIINIKHSRILLSKYIENAFMIIITNQENARIFNISEIFIEQCFSGGRMLVYFPNNKTYYCL